MYASVMIDMILSIRLSQQDLLKEVNKMLNTQQCQCICSFGNLNPHSSKFTPMLLFVLRYLDLVGLICVGQQALTVCLDLQRSNEQAERHKPRHLVRLSRTEDRPASVLECQSICPDAPSCTLSCLSPQRVPS